MDNIDKLNEIFKSGDINLGIQLIKSLDLELYDVLLELYHKFKYLYVNTRITTSMVWWTLDTSDPMSDFNHCIRFMEYDNPPYRCWFGDLKSKEYDNVEDCITELTKVLKENYG